MKQKGNPAVISAAAAMSSFLTPFMGSAINIALPDIGREFSMNALTLNWVSTSYLIASAILILPFSRAADLYGKKRIFTRGLVIFTITSFLLAFSPTEAVLILLRVLQGIGSSMIFGTGVAILTEAYPPEKRGRALGINLAATYLGLSLGPFIGGTLTLRFGWESVFLANVPISLLALLLAVRGIGEDARGDGLDKIDFPGSLLYSFSLIATMYGFSRIPASAGLWLTMAGVSGLGFFILWEKKAESPLLDIRLMTQNRQFAFSNLAAFIHYSATFAATFLMSLYLQYIQGMDPEKAGLILVSQPIVMMALSPLAGRLSDKIEPRFLASAGMVVSCIGLGLLAFLGQDSGILQILLPLVLLGLGFAFFSSPNTNAVMSSVPRETYGIAAGMASTMRLTGQTGSMGIALMLFALFMGQSKITPEVYPQFMQSMKAGFIIFSLLCAIGAFASLARGRIHET